MKKVFTSQNMTHCDMVRVILEDVDIPSMLKNEYASRTAGVGITGGLAFAWPEVWVDDEDLHRAEQTVKNSGLSFVNSTG